MRIICCERCGSLDAEKRVHVAAMDEIHEELYREYADAHAEYMRIARLFREVAWYNADTFTCRWWNLRRKQVALYGVRHEVYPVRGGRARQRCTFREYYVGDATDARPLPPEIILHELKMSHDLMMAAFDAVSAPYDWAPGGDKYEKLVRESPGVYEYERRRLATSSKAQKTTNGHASSQGGSFYRLGDRLEREVEEETQPPARELLGRVRGDRSVVP